MADADWHADGDDMLTDIMNIARNGFVAPNLIKSFDMFEFSAHSGRPHEWSASSRGIGIRELPIQHHGSWGCFHGIDTNKRAVELLLLDRRHIDLYSERWRRPKLI